MQQRLQIARNLVTGPRLVFMDEPTGGLDVSVQARLLDLLRGLVRDMGLSAVVVTHDLAVVRLLAHRIMVMKDGRVVEEGSRTRCWTTRGTPTRSSSCPPSCRCEPHDPR
jgi:putative phosphonate transport system ATP-binding protein